MVDPLLPLSPESSRFWLIVGSSDNSRGLVKGEKDKMTPRDLQATILHQLGLDPYKLHYPYLGLNQRLIGPTDEGRVMKDLLV